MRVKETFQKTVKEKFDVCKNCGEEFVRYDPITDRLICFSDKCRNKETSYKTVVVSRKKRTDFSTIE